MGQPKELKMPKGKILMGKKTPEPTPTQVNVRKRNPRQPIGGPGVGKPKPVKPRPKGMPPVYGNSNYKPKPTPKRTIMDVVFPGKPTPKGKVFERKLENNEQKKGGPLSLAELRKRNTIGGAGSVKRKPVMPRRGGK